eukprot:gene26765-30247_t
MLLPLLLLLGLLTTAVWHDIKARRIPNALVLPGALAGLALQGLLPAGGGFYTTPFGALGLLLGLAGMALGLALLLPMYMLGTMGAGDVKLLAMAGAFMFGMQAALSMGWRDAAKPLVTAPATQGKRIFLIDKPDAPQSTIMAAHMSLPQGQPDDLALEPVMTNFGGMATARLNRNLRLDKHWSYGTSSQIPATRGQRPFFVVAPVQTDKTREAMLEVAKEIKDIAGARPITGEEYTSIMRTVTSRLAGGGETTPPLGRGRRAGGWWDAKVTVAELVPAVVDWARGPMTEIYAGSLDDPRVTIHVGDVGALIAKSKGVFDAILLDVDNGPDGLTREAND